jgi:hypothetical protein
MEDKVIKIEYQEEEDEAEKEDEEGDDADADGEQEKDETEEQQKGLPRKVTKSRGSKMREYNYLKSVKSVEELNNFRFKVI